MNLHRRALMTANNRNVSDLPREELEALVMEMQQELVKRKKKEADLIRHVTVFGSKVKSVEESLQDQNLDYLVPPSALRAGYAQNYAQPLTKAIDSDVATGEDGEPAPEHYEHYETRIAGSYNPFQGANRRIVTLRQKAGDIQQKIVDTHNDMIQLH